MIGRMPWMDFSRITKVILKNYKKIGKWPNLTVEMNFQKMSSLQFVMVQGSLNPNMKFLDEILRPVA